MNTAEANLSLMELMELFPDNATAEKWFEERRWPNGRFCPHCGSTDTIETKNRRPQPYRCRDCDGHFSVRKGSVMEASNISYQKWGLATYLFLLDPKGCSSIRLHNQLGISQPAAWHMLHRLRESFPTYDERMEGPVEVDETFIGGLRQNMSTERYKQVRHLGRGTGGKHVVVGIKDRATGKVVARHISDTTSETLHAYIKEHVEPGATVYTDEARGYRNLRGFKHASVEHGRRVYVRDDVHVNGIESFWSNIKRAYKGTYHYMSPKHLSRYVKESTGRFNMREHDMITRMEALTKGMVGKRLRYKDLTKHGTNRTQEQT